MSGRELRGLVVLGLALWFGTLLSPDFWQPEFLLFNTGAYVEVGLLALSMTLVIVNGDIDLSVGAMLAMCACLLGELTQHGVPVWLAALAAVGLGPVLGFVNGWLVTRFDLPSLVVTLGTMALFRGLSKVILGDLSVAGFPDWFVGVDQYSLGTSPDVPSLVVVFLAVAGGFAVLLHRTTYGQLCRLVGSNRTAAAFTGVRVDVIRRRAFVLSGLTAGLGSVVYVSRLGSIRADAASGYELLAITVVVLGGTDIFGGRGSVLATVIAFFSVVALRQAMSVDLVNGQVQDCVIGAVLIASILLPTVATSLSQRLSGRRSHTIRTTNPRRPDTHTAIAVNHGGNSDRS